MIRVADKELAWHPGLTVEELLLGLEDGRQVAVVRLNGRLVSRPHFATTLVPDRAEVIPLPMIAGG
jgi:sulfur carrier protein ThiS